MCMRWWAEKHPTGVQGMESVFLRKDLGGELQIQRVQTTSQLFQGTSWILYINHIRTGKYTHLWFSISSFQEYLSSVLGLSAVLSTAYGLCRLILRFTLRIRYCYSPQCKDEEIKARGYTKITEAAKLNPSNQPREPELYKHHILSFEKPGIYGQKKPVFLHVLGFSSKHKNNAKHTSVFSSLN